MPNEQSVLALINEIDESYIKDVPPVNGGNWDTTKITDKKIIVSHPTEVTIEIRQKQENNQFEAIRITPNGDEFKLGESPDFENALRAGEAYMYGFSEYKNQFGSWDPNR